MDYYDEKSVPGKIKKRAGDNVRSETMITFGETQYFISLAQGQ